MAAGDGAGAGRDLVDPQAQHGRGTDNRRVRVRALKGPDRTRRTIIDAAAKEFSQHGFDGTTISAVARRAKVSKQLVHYHFASKEDLFRNVHAERFRPAADWRETVPDNPADLFAARFERRAKDLAYVRFLAWEAASIRNRTIPGERERQVRLSQYGADLKRLQEDGRIPADLDHDLVQLAILSLATYPIAFSQVTRLVTGTKGTDAGFQRRWAAFLRLLGRRFFR